MYATHESERLFLSGDARCNVDSTGGNARGRVEINYSQYCSGTHAINSGRLTRVRATDKRICVSDRLVRYLSIDTYLSRWIHIGRDERYPVKVLPFRKFLSLSLSVPKRRFYICFEFFRNKIKLATMT